MPLPKPSPGQSKDEFISSCMASSVMNDEYPDQEQRAAVCNSIWEEKDMVNMDNKAVIKIYGDIGESPDMYGIEETMSLKKVSDFLDENKDADTIVVRINSRGGDVQEGWAIHDALVNSGKKIITVGEGKVYSIATIIFLAGEEREIMKNADGQIHNPFIPPFTLADKYESDDLEKLALALQQEEEKILAFYVEKTGADEATLAEYMKEDTKLSAQDMLDLGFATKIIEPIKAFAYVKPIKNIEMIDEKKFFEKLGNKLDEAVTKISNFSRITPKDQTLKDKDGNEFTLEKETGAPEVGDKAAPDGVYNMESGAVITVKDGTIESINKPDAQGDDLEQAKAEIEELKGKIEVLEAEKLDHETKAAELKAKEEELETQVTEAKALVTELKTLKNDWKPESRGHIRISSGDKVGDIDLVKARELIAKRKEKEAKN